MKLTNSANLVHKLLYGIMTLTLVASASVARRFAAFDHTTDAGYVGRRRPDWFMPKIYPWEGRDD